VDSRNRARGRMALLMLAVLCAGCGGGADKPPVAAAPTVQQTLAIVTPSLPSVSFSEYYSATLQATGGTGNLQWAIGDGALGSGLSLDREKGIISGVVTDLFLRTPFIVVVKDSAGRVASRQFTMTLDNRPETLKFLTTSLPDAIVNQPYSVAILTSRSSNLQLAPGSDPFPPGMVMHGLNFMPTGSTLGGQPTQEGTFEFTLEAQNAATTVRQLFRLRVKASGSRNDEISEAPLISSGGYMASISPFADPVSQANPDQDFYKLIAQPGNVLSVEIAAESLGPLDSVIELVDASGTRLTTCDVPGTSGFTSPCMNDDNLEEFTLDSKLLFKAPAGAPTTLFLRVLDWRGDARPDMQYVLRIFGAD
jgi:hypothetical protein